VLTREYGFAGWQDLRAAVLRQEGKGLEWAVAEAERAVHDNSIEDWRKWFGSIRRCYRGAPIAENRY
jgi:hypothetical protein